MQCAPLVSAANSPDCCGCLHANIAADPAHHRPSGWEPILPTLPAGYNTSLTQHQHCCDRCLQVSSDYVGGVSLLPGGNHVAAAAADGSISLLEWRRAGVKVATASCGAPLRCCACDGHLMISGTENGQLMMWNLSQLLGQPAGEGFSLAGPDGVYPAVSCPSKAAVNGIGVGVLSPPAGSEQAVCSVVAALDDGVLVLFNN